MRRITRKREESCILTIGRQNYAPTQTKCVICRFLPFPNIIQHTVSLVSKFSLFSAYLYWG